MQTAARPTHAHNGAPPQRQPASQPTWPCMRRTALSYTRAASTSSVKLPMKCCLVTAHTRTSQRALRSCQLTPRNLRRAGAGLLRQGPRAAGAGPRQSRHAGSRCGAASHHRGAGKHSVAAGEASPPSAPAAALPSAHHQVDEEAEDHDSQQPHCQLLRLLDRLVRHQQEDEQRVQASQQDAGQQGQPE